MYESDAAWVAKSAYDSAMDGSMDTSAGGGGGSSFAGIGGGGTSAQGRQGRALGEGHEVRLHAESSSFFMVQVVLKCCRPTNVSPCFSRSF